MLGVCGQKARSMQLQLQQPGNGGASKEILTRGLGLTTELGSYVVKSIAAACTAERDGGAGLSLVMALELWPVMTSLQTSLPGTWSIGCRRTFIHTSCICVKITPAWLSCRCH